MHSPNKTVKISQTQNGYLWTRLKCDGFAAAIISLHGSASQHMNSQHGVQLLDEDRDLSSKVCWPVTYTDRCFHLWQLIECLNRVGD